MTGRTTPRRRGPLGIERLSMFVPAVMGIGLVSWVTSQVLGLAHTRARDARRRRARTAAGGLVQQALGRTAGPVPCIRPRWTYLAVAAALLGLGGYLAVGTTANFASPDGYVHGIAWLLALGLLASGLALVYGVAAGVAFLAWPAPPAWARGLLLRTPLGTAPIDPQEAAAHPPPSLSIAVVLAALLAGFVSLFVVSSPELADQADRAVAGWFVEHDPLPRLVAVGLLGRVPVTLGALVLVGLAAFRCRVLAAAFSAVAVVTVGLELVLPRLVAHPRPELGAFAGQLDSLPATPVLIGTLFAGLFPLALAVITARRWVIWPARAALGLLVVANASHLVATSEQWPSDVVVAAAIGIALVLATDWAVLTVGFHTHCHDCLWAGPRTGHVHSAVLLRPSWQGWLHIAASLSAAAATIAVTALALEVELPTETGSSTLGAPVQLAIELGLASLFLLGALIGWRWPAPAAVIVAIAAAGAGIYVAAELTPTSAAVVAGLLGIPAFLLWLAWQHRRRPAEIVAVAVLTSLLISGTYAGATAVYDHFYGPTHPASTAVLPPLDRVMWVWAGGLHDEGVVVTAQLDGGAEARLTVLGEDGAVHRSPAATADEHGLVRLELEGLRPATPYTFRIEVDGRPDEGRGFGAFRTPAEGAQSFRLTVGACAMTGSEGAVFDAIRAEQPLLHLVTGDLHYANVESTEVEPHLVPYRQVLTSPAQAALARAVPMAYVWDDHDYGPNDADATFPGRAASREAFRDGVPHGPMLEGDAPIQQAFTVGRVRVVMSDLRSERTDTQIMSDEQQAWLVEELRTASRTHALVLWVSSVPWIGPATPGSDTWAGYAEQRGEIAQAIADAGIENLVMLAGDAHMVALDDGTNSGYAAGGGPGFPVLHAAALDRPGSVKGGPYSDGAFPGGGQYGVVDVVDDGGPTVSVQLRGRTWEGTTLVDRTFVLPVGADAG